MSAARNANTFVNNNYAIVCNDGSELVLDTYAFVKLLGVFSCASTVARQMHTASECNFKALWNLDFNAYKVDFIKFNDADVVTNDKPLVVTDDYPSIVACIVGDPRVGFRITTPSNIKVVSKTLAMLGIAIAYARRWSFSTPPDTFTKGKLTVISETELLQSNDGVVEAIVTHFHNENISDVCSLGVDNGSYELKQLMQNVHGVQTNQPVTENSIRLLIIMHYQRTAADKVSDLLNAHEVSGV